MNPSPPRYYLKGPSPWFLGPVLTSFVLHSIAHKDQVWMLICTFGILSSYINPKVLNWPKGIQWFKALFVIFGMWLLAYSYFVFALNKGAHLSYFQHVLFKPTLITTSSLVASLCLILVWHISFAQKERGWVVYALSGIIVLSSGHFYQLPGYYGATLFFYCATVVFCLFMAGTGHQARGTSWIPNQTFILMFLFWLTMVSVGTWGFLKGLQELDKRKTLSAFIRLPRYSGSLGTQSSMLLPHKEDVKLSNQLVATLISPAPPPYLRTKVMDIYDHGIWRTTRRSRRLLPKSLTHQIVRYAVHSAQGAISLHRRPISRSLPTTQPRLQRPPRNTKKHKLEVHHIKNYTDLKGVILMGYNTRLLELETGARCYIRKGWTLSCYPKNLARLYNLRRSTQSSITFGIGLTVPELSKDFFLQQKEHKPRGNSLKRVLRLLRPLTQRITGKDKGHPLRAAQHIQNHFRTHYKYSLRVRLAEREDPVLDFVLNKRPAFCQYFASGMALMLRSIGHQTRIATGFMVKEYNPLSKRWIVRQKDAHAWTEVFDPQRKIWVGYDATAPSMTARPKVFKGIQFFKDFWTSVQLRWRAFWEWLRTVDLEQWMKQKITHLWSQLLQPQGLAMVGFLLCLFILLKNARQFFTLLRRETSQRPKKHARTKQQEQVYQLLQGVLLHCSTAFVPIQKYETIDEYIERLWLETDTESVPKKLQELEELTDFFRLYQVLRFEPQERTTMDGLRTLHDLGQRILLRLKR